MKTTTNRFLGVLAGAFAVAAAGTMLTSAASPKFYPDDPVWIEHDTQDASSIKPLEVDLFVDLTANLVTGREVPVARRAANINTVDEVPGFELVHQSPRPSSDVSSRKSRKGRTPPTDPRQARGRSRRRRATASRRASR